MIVFICIQAPNCVLPIQNDIRLFISACWTSTLLKVELFKGQENTLIIFNLRIAYNNTFVKADRLADLKPWMLPDVFDLGTMLRVFCQNCPDQVNDIIADKFWYYVLALKYFVIEQTSVRVLKWQKTANKSVQNNATTPHIDFITLIFEAGNHLRRCITRTTTGRL